MILLTVGAFQIKDDIEDTEIIQAASPTAFVGFR